MRAERWNKAFPDSSCADISTEESETEVANRKLTAVVELMMQVADINHTMQHWQVYIKWNRSLLLETYACHRHDKDLNAKDPSDGWYKGELWFFDNYVIPCAKRMKGSGAFGHVADECLGNALSNRAEWAKYGEDVVTEWLASEQFQNYLDVNCRLQEATTR